MSIREKSAEKGRVEIELHRPDGSVEREAVDNLVVDAGLEWVAARRHSNGVPVMSHIAIGEGAAAPVQENTALEYEVGRVAMSPKTLSGTDVVYEATFPAGVGTGAITEAGVFNADEAGTMECRVTFAVKNKGADDILVIRWTRSTVGVE